VPRSGAHARLLGASDPGRCARSRGSAHLLNPGRYQVEQVLASPLGEARVGNTLLACAQWTTPPSPSASSWAHASASSRPRTGPDTPSTAPTFPSGVAGSGTRLGSGIRWRRARGTGRTWILSRGSVAPLRSAQGCRGAPETPMGGSSLTEISSIFRSWSIANTLCS
jgi:hypothetical protein